MDERQSAMLWQLMQSLSTQTNETLANHTEEPTNANNHQFEHTLLSLRPMLPPRQQKILDLVIKMQEVMTLLEELSA